MAWPATWWCDLWKPSHMEVRRPFGVGWRRKRLKNGNQRNGEATGSLALVGLSLPSHLLPLPPLANPNHCSQPPRTSPHAPT